MSSRVLQVGEGPFICSNSHRSLLHSSCTKRIVWALFSVGTKLVSLYPLVPIESTERSRQSKVSVTWLQGTDLFCCEGSIFKAPVHEPDLRRRRISVSGLLVRLPGFWTRYDTRSYKVLCPETKSHPSSIVKVTARLEPRLDRRYHHP